MNCIGAHHCTLTWDGNDNEPSVVVRDLSQNGTFVSSYYVLSPFIYRHPSIHDQINGYKIGQNQMRILRDGNEISFGSSTPQAGNENYREHLHRLFTTTVTPHSRAGYIYRHAALPAPQTDFQVNYELTPTILGTGSFGVVQLAIQKSTGKWFAVKKVEKTKAMNTRDKVSREIAIMESLAHRNICRLHETFVSEGVKNICISEYLFHHYRQ